METFRILKNYKPRKNCLLYLHASELPECMERPWGIGNFSDIRVRRAVRTLSCRRSYWRISFRNWNSEHRNEKQCVFVWNVFSGRMCLRLECVSISMYPRLEYVSSSNVPPVGMCLLLERVSSWNVPPVGMCPGRMSPVPMSPVRIYLRLQCVPRSNVPPVGMSPVRIYLRLQCLQFECLRL
jgi:hypothetical protein